MGKIHHYQKENIRRENKMPKEKTKKLNIMSCKCESGIYGESAVLKNCKCRPSGRKEREYESVLIEKI